MRSRIIGALILAGALAAPMALAQSDPYGQSSRPSPGDNPSSGNRMGSDQSAGSGPSGAMGNAGMVPIYDKTAEQSVMGNLSHVRTLNLAGIPNALVAVIDDNGTTMNVCFGPKAFLDSNNMALADNDRVTIRGAMTMISGQDYLLAGQVTKGSQTLPLMDAGGKPLWARSQLPQ